MSVVPSLPEAAESEPFPPAAREDLVGVRIAAALIDLALLLALFAVLVVVIGETDVNGDGVSFGLTGVDAWLFAGLVLLYYFGLEATIGRTVGKLLLGLRVVHRDGGRPSVGAVAVRTVLRVVDWLPALYLVGFIAMLMTGSRRQRLGDLAARTGIARAEHLRHRGIAAAALAAAVVLTLAGSAGYVALSDQGDKTYRAHGVSFDYPAGWEQRGLDVVAQGGGGNRLWDTTVGIGESDFAAVQAYRLRQPITAETLDAVKPEATSTVAGLFQQVGGTLRAGPEEITVADMPGLRYRGEYTAAGTPVVSTMVLAFDGTTQYFFNCQYTGENAEEIQQGCTQIMDTFKLE